MANYEDEAKKQFGQLNQKFEKLKAKQILTFSSAALSEFSIGFYSPIIGSLAYLQQNTATHRSIRCVASCNQLKDKTITSDGGYDDFTDELSQLTPPAGIDFTFILTDSVYPIGEISEKFSVYFTNSGYEIVYGNEDVNELRLPKQYMSHIEPDEIRQLRDLIALSITKKVGHKLDELIN